MKDRHFFKTVRQRSCLAAGLIALVAIVGMAGTYYYKTAKTREDTRQEQIASDGEANAEVTDADYNSPQNSETEQDSDSATEAMTQHMADQDRLDSGQSIQGNVEQSAAGTEFVASASGSTEASVKLAEQDAVTLHFSDTSEMDWPVRGDVILPYSMDKTVYFSTLDQYKYNPAMLIAASVNMKVTAAADEKITDVSTNEDTGLTVTADLGNGYFITYGQLKEVELNPGDMVSRGDVIGYVSEPTKYYCVEGTNLYLAMTKDDTPVNPMDFLE